MYSLLFPILHNQQAICIVTGFLSLFVLCSPAVIHKIVRNNAKRRNIAQKLRVLEGTLVEIDQKLQLATNVATNHYQVMTATSDLALYAIRKEMIRLCDIRNEVQNILGYGKVAELQHAESLLLSANQSAEVGDAMRKFLRPSIPVVEHTDFASIRRLMTFTLLHVKGEANVLA